jgi:hypothetical protein
MNKNGNIFRRAGWIAFLALMLQVVLPLLHPAMAASVASNQHIRLCSVASKSTDAEKSSPQKMPSCPICMSMHMLSGGSLVPPDVVIAVLQLRGFTIIPLPQVKIEIIRTAFSQQPRAPPSLV